MNSFSQKEKNPSYFVLTDIHGCADELRALLEKLPLQADSRFIFLGDYVDRGPSSKEVIDIIIELKKKYEVVTLMGNHEDLFLSFLENPEGPKAGVFVYNGGTATLASYSNEYGEYNIPESHHDFLINLKKYHETEDYFFVHAGVPNKPLSEICEEDHDKLMWIRSPFLESQYTWDKVIIHGHTPSEEPELLDKRINIDTGCVYNGHLTALELPSKKIYQVQRSEEMEHIYLKDKSSRRKAVRFYGIVPVWLNIKGKTHNLVATNYTDFGLLLKDQSHGTKSFLMDDQIIAGQIGTEEKKVSFEGRVLRHEVRKGAVFYAIEFTKTPFEFIDKEKGMTR